MQIQMIIQKNLLKSIKIISVLLGIKKIMGFYDAVDQAIKFQKAI